MGLFQGRGLDRAGCPKRMNDQRMSMTSHGSGRKIIYPRHLQVLSDPVLDI